MAKKSPARSKQRTAKPTAKAKVAARTKVAAKTKVTAKAKGRATPKPRRAATATPSPAAADLAERLGQAMEELIEARAELSRVGHALNASHRELEERKLSSGAAEENLRAELEAVHNDLKEALAELEISRNEVARLRAKLGGDQLGNWEVMAAKKPSGSSPIE